jgi:hypothetical protein
MDTYRWSSSSSSDIRLGFSCEGEEVVMPEYIAGFTYTFTIYPKRTDLEVWFKSYDVKGVEVELDLYYAVPGYYEYFLIGKGKIHTDENGNIIEDSVSYTGKFNHVGNLTLVLRAIPPDVYRGYETVTVRYPRLIVKVTDDKGNPLEGVEVLAYPEGWVSPLRGVTDSSGVAIIDLRDPSTAAPIVDLSMKVYVRKSGYDKYPDYTFLGSAPSPLSTGDDTSISGVMHYTAPKPPVEVTVIVYDYTTGYPIAGAMVELNALSTSTDSSGKAKFTISTGSYPLTVSKSGYETYSGTVNITEACTIEVHLHPIYITVTVIVYDAYTKKPIQGATVTLDSTPKTTDADGIAVFTNVQGARTASIKVEYPGYQDYVGEVSLPAGNVEIGVELIPKIVLPKITLSVDKTSIAEGETVTFTVEPSDIDVDLYEIIGTEYKYILTFRGQTSLKPEAGDHTYAVKYIYKYGTYTSEIWSNIVYVHVEVGKPFAVENWTVKVNVQVNGEPVGEGEAEVELNETTEWQTAKHHYGPIPTDSNGWAVFSKVAGAYYLGEKKYSDMKYDVIAKLKVEKMGIPAGSILKASLILEDGSYKTG